MIKTQKYQIDQSGKIEQTQVKTVVAMTNSQAFAVTLTAADKKLLEQMFRQLKRPRLFPYLVFAALLAILIKKAKPKQKVQVDQEYIGQNDLIIERYHKYMSLLNVKPIPHIEFGHVGKSARVHRFGYLIWSGKKKDLFVVPIKDILKLIFGTKNDREPRGVKV